MPNLPGLTPVDDPSIQGSTPQGARVQPRDTASDPQRLQPTATPVDTYVRAMQPAPDNALMQLAQGLQAFNPALERWANVDAQQQHEDLPGKVMAAKVTSSSDAEFQQKLHDDPDLQSRFAQRLGMKQLGLGQADTAVSHMVQDYQTGKFDKAGGDFNAWSADYARRDLEAHKADPSYAAGYAERFEAAKASLSHDLTQYRTQQTVAGQDQGIFGAMLATVNSGADTSADPGKIVANLQQQFKTNDIVLAKSPEEQAKLQLDLLRNLTARLGDDPKRAPFLSKVIEGLASADRTGLDGKSIGSLMTNVATQGQAAGILREARDATTRQDLVTHSTDIAKLGDAARTGDPDFQKKLFEASQANPKWFSGGEMAHLQETWMAAQRHQQTLLTKQQREQSEEYGRFLVTNQALLMAADSKLHLLEPKTIIGADGKDLVISIDEQIKDATKARMAQIDQAAAEKGLPADAVFRAKADFFQRNPVAVNDQWKTALTVGPSAASVGLAAGGGQPLPALRDGYQLYRQLSAVAPGVLNNHSTDASREFYERARVAQDVMGMDESGALALAARAQDEKRRGVEAPAIKERDFLSKANSLLGSWWGDSNANSVNHQQVFNELRAAAGDLVLANHLSWDDAIAQAAPRVKANYTVINGVSVRTADKRLPSDFPTVMNRYFDVWYDAHKPELDMLGYDRSDLSMASVGTGSAWRIVGRHGMIDMEIPDASISIANVYRTVMDLHKQEDKAAGEHMTQVEHDRQTSFFDRTELLRAQVDRGLAMNIGGFSPKLMTRQTARDELTKMMAHPDYANGKALREQEKAAVDREANDPTYKPLPGDLVGVPGGTVDKQAAPKSYLTSFLAPGMGPESLTGLDGDLHDNLSHLIAAAPESIRKDLKINSGTRSEAKQAALFDQAKAKYGSEDAARKWVAPPGKSQHNAGKAIDLGFGSDAAREWVHENARRFNLWFPLNNEPWHIEATGSRYR